MYRELVTFVYCLPKADYRIQTPDGGSASKADNQGYTGQGADRFLKGATVAVEWQLPNTETGKSFTTHESYFRSGSNLVIREMSCK